VIVAQHVSKSFGSLKALNDVSLTCHKGQCIALLGPNGSGKTTFIKSILGMVVPDKGLITFQEKNIANEWRYREHIGYMPQIGRYPDNMTIGQVFDMMKDIRGEIHTDTELVEAFELDKMKDKRMRTLSGGTRQKVSAALAFLFDVDLLVLDEPTAGLDPLASEILKRKIISAKEKGKLILISSHILSELDELISEVIYLQDGRLIFHKGLDELKKETGESKLSKAIVKVMFKQETKA